MIVKKRDIPSPFGKNPEWNIFYVYTEMPRAKQATVEMKSLCDRFAMDFARVSKKFQSEGLDDSGSRETAIRYIVEKIEPIRKTLRLRAEAGMKALPYRK